MADLLVAAGINSVLNFTPAVVSVPDSASLRKVDLAVELQILSFYQQRHAGLLPADGPEPVPGARHRRVGPRRGRRSVTSQRRARLTGRLVPMNAPLYPVNLVLRGRRCLVVHGGGRVAAQKVAGLLECEAAVTVISPELDPVLADTAQDGSITVTAAVPGGGRPGVPPGRSPRRRIPR